MATRQRTAYYKKRRVNRRKEFAAGNLEIKHGVASSYALGCRCDECKYAKMLSNLPDRLAKYNITVEQFDAFMEKQGHACAVCRLPFTSGTRFCIDHDHACCKPRSQSCGKCVRGILCNNCNIGLGYMKDNREALIRAAAYLS